MNKNQVWFAVAIFGVFISLLISMIVEGVRAHRARERELDEMAKQNDPRLRK